MPAPIAADVCVLDVPEHSRFEIRVGGELAFVRGFIARHSDEYVDLVPADLRGAFELQGDH